LGGISLTTVDEWNGEKERLSESQDDDWVFLGVEEYVDSDNAESPASVDVNENEVTQTKSWCILA